MDLTRLWRRCVSELSVTGDLRASAETEPERTGIPVSCGGRVTAGQHDQPRRRSGLSRVASERDTYDVRQFGAVHDGRRGTGGAGEG